MMIELTERQTKSLSILAEHEHCSLNELVREAVNDYLNRHPLQQDSDSAFGLWRHKREDGLAYQERLRSEWCDESTV
ncbi:CopG family transcriptional regulator [Allochromatium warmingii]|nr:CopG family transcriptional regulator [Allochromatium warmingii]